MNKKRMLFISILGSVLLCAGLFYWYTERQANYAETRDLFAPIYEFSGKLTPEKQKRFSEHVNAMMNVEPSVAKKYALPKRERLQLEAHIMTLQRDNPELFFREHGHLPSGTDVDPYIRYFSTRALIAKTKLADLPTNSRKSIISHLETLEQRLTKNSVEVYMQEIRNLPDHPRQKAPPMRFGVASAPSEVGGGVVQITDVYDNEYTVDLDAPTDTEMTERTAELYAEIDRIFEQLTDAEFQRLATLNKADRSAEVEKLFSTE